MPQSVSVPRIQADGPVRRLPVSGYSLALSWSPEFCKGRELQARHSTQCSGRNGRFGLVVHGLWPEGRGTWPQWCQAGRAVTAREVGRNLCMMPSARLVARQWAKHGSCMTRKPDTYFKITRILWRSLRIPDFDRLSRSDNLTAGTIRARFAEVNRGWEEEHIGVHLNARGWLEELRLCYGPRFRPAPCDARRRGARDNTRARIWRGL